MISNGLRIGFRHNLTWQLLSSICQLAVGALVLVVMAHGLGATDFGLFSLIMALVLVANALFEPRMQDVAARHYWVLAEQEGLPRPLHQLLRALLIVEIGGKILPCIALIILSPFLAHISNQTSHAATLICLAAIGTFLSRIGFGVSTGLLRVAGRSDLLAYCQVGELVFRFLLLLALTALSSLTVTAAIVLQSTTATCALMAQWWLTSRVVGPLAPFDNAGGAEGFWTSLLPVRSLICANLSLTWSDLMNKDLDVTILAPFLSVDLVGLYKMAKNIVLLTWRAIDPVFLALMPEVSRMAANRDFEAIRALIYKASLWLAVAAILISSLVYCILSVFGDHIFGSAFTALPKLVPIMSVGVIVSAPLIWGHPLAVALNRPDIAVIGSVCGAVVGAVLLSILVPTFGIRGAGAGWSATFAVNFIIVAFWTHKLLNRHDTPSD